MTRAPKICVTQDCQKIVTDGHARCSTCRFRLRRHGNTDAPDPRRTSDGKPRCKVEGCRLVARAKGMCLTHYARERRGGDPTTLTISAGGKESLPVAPLVAYVEERGGLMACLDEAGIYNRGRDFRPRESLRKNYDRAVVRGTIPIFTADQLVIALFRVHPVEVWGDTWWGDEVPEPSIERVAA